MAGAQGPPPAPCLPHEGQNFPGPLHVVPHPPRQSPPWPHRAPLENPGSALSLEERCPQMGRAGYLIQMLKKIKFNDALSQGVQIKKNQIVKKKFFFLLQMKLKLKLFWRHQGFIPLPFFSEPVAFRTKSRRKKFILRTSFANLRHVFRFHYQIKFPTDT